MRTFRILLRRELRAWLHSPANHFMAAVFLLVSGASFCSLALTQSGQGLLTTELTFGSAVFWIAALALGAVCAPRVFAEERDSGTIELLLTAPVRDSEVVWAKYVSLILCLGLLYLLAAAPPWLLWALNRDWSGFDAGAWVAAVIQTGLALLVIAAAGIFVSLLFRGQSAAAAVTFLSGGVLIFGAGAGLWTGFDSHGVFHRVFEARLSLDMFASGVVDSRWIVLCVSAAAVLIFGSIQLLGWARFREWRGGLQICVSIVLAAVLAAMANWISARHFARWDCSSGRSSGLTGQTVEILRAVKAPATITLVGPASERRVREARRFLDRCAELCPVLSIEHVDPQVALAKTRELAQAFGLREAEVMVVESRGRYTVVSLKDAHPVPGTVSSPESRPETEAAGLEGRMASALHAMTREKIPVVCFLTGQGERSVEDFGDYSGYSEIASLIRRRQATVRVGTLEAWTDDCSVVVVAGPARSLSAWEAGKLREQLARGIRLMFLLDAGRESGLEPLLAEWGIKAGSDRVVEAATASVEPDRKGKAAPRGLGEVHVTRYGKHPVTAGLDGVVTTFYLPRSVEPLRGEDPSGNLTDIADRPRVATLALSGRASWADSDFTETPPRFSEGFDRRGPIPVAACVEKGASSPVAMDIKPVRMAVFGDSQFVANRCITEGNLRLFMNALEWLLDEERPITTGVRRFGVFDLSMTPSGKWILIGVVLAGVPGVMILTGIVVFLLRRDQRTARSGPGPERGAK